MKKVVSGYRISDKETTEHTEYTENKSKFFNRF